MYEHAFSWGIYIYNIYNIYIYIYMASLIYGIFLKRILNWLLWIGHTGGMNKKIIWDFILFYCILLITFYSFIS